MSVAAIPSTMTSFDTTTTTDASHGLSSMDDFLLLFTTQLQHQDPTNPMESYELSAQLAQFSTVEKLTSIDETLASQTDYLASINNAQGFQFIGKEVLVSESQLQIDGDQVTQGVLSLDADADDVVIKIYDGAGHLVRTLNLGPQLGGRIDFQWDGTDDEGNKLPDGTYTFEAGASNATGNPVQVNTMITDRVYGVRLDDGVSYLVLGGSDGLKVPVGSVIEVQNASGSESMENGTENPGRDRVEM